MFPRRGSPERLSRPPHVTCRRWNMALQQSWIPNFYCHVRQGWVVRFLFFSICCVFLSVHLTFLYISLVQSRVLAVVCCFLLLFIFCVFLLFVTSWFLLFSVYQMWTYHYDGLRWELADDWRLNSSWNLSRCGITAVNSNRGRMHVASDRCRSYYISIIMIYHVIYILYIYIYLMLYS